MPKVNNDESQEEVKEQEESTEELPSWTDELGDAYEPAGGLKSMLSQYGVESEEEDDDPKNNKDTKEKNSSSEEEGEGEEREEREESSEPNLEEMDSPVLIEEVKKHQRISEERLTQVREYEKKIKDYETEKEKLLAQAEGKVDPAVNKFIEGLRTDPIGTWKKMSDELKLPQANILETYFEAAKDADKQIALWQDNVLKKEVEEKFNLESGTFRFDGDEADDAKSPSYYWRRRTRQKEAELETSLGEAEARRKKIEKESLERQAEAIKWYADTFYEGDAKKADEAIKELNSIPERILKKELPPDKHPFSMKTLLLGVNFDTLVEAKVEKAVKALQKEYKEKGIMLKNGQEYPVDLSTLKSKGELSSRKRNEKTYSPAESAMDNYL